MKIREKFNFYVVVTTVLLFVGISAFVAVSTRSLMVNEAERTVRSMVKATVGRIDRLMTGVEAAAANSVWIVNEHLNDPDYMYRITRELVENNEFIIQAGILPHDARGDISAFQRPAREVGGDLYRNHAACEHRHEQGQRP